MITTESPIFFNYSIKFYFLSLWLMRVKPLAIEPKFKIKLMKRKGKFCLFRRPDYQQNIGFTLIPRLHVILGSSICTECNTF